MEEVIALKINVKPFIVSLAVPLIVGGASALITRGSMEHFEALDKPPLAPPGTVFPIVWTILFILMGIACYRITQSGARLPKKRKALTLYGFQLVVNFIWPILFFNLEAYWAAFAWLAFLWVLIIAVMASFHSLDKAAGWLLVPYFLWVTFAGYLNLAIALLN